MGGNRGRHYEHEDEHDDDSPDYGEDGYTPPSVNFEYTDINTVPLHKNIAKMVLGRVDARVICNAYGISSTYLQRLKNHPPFKDEVRRLQVEINMRSYEQAERMQGILNGALDNTQLAQQKIREKLAMEDLSVNEVLAIERQSMTSAEKICERTPGGMFKKIDRTQVSFEANLNLPAPEEHAKEGVRARMLEINRAGQQGDDDDDAIDVEASGGSDT